MKLLLDTHILIWLIDGSPELGPRAREAIDRAARHDGITISSISFWEVAMLSTRGRVALARPLFHWRQLVLSLQGVAEEPVTGDIGIEAVQLPGALHSDPVDRLLVATARLRGLQLGTRDAKIVDYAKDGYVDVLAL